MINVYLIYVLLSLGTTTELHEKRKKAYQLSVPQRVLEKRIVSLLVLGLSKGFVDNK